MMSQWTLRSMSGLITALATVAIMTMTNAGSSDPLHVRSDSCSALGIFILSTERICRRHADQILQAALELRLVHESDDA